MKRSHIQKKAYGVMLLYHPTLLQSFIPISVFTSVDYCTYEAFENTSWSLHLPGAQVSTYSNFFFASFNSFTTC